MAAASKTSAGRSKKGAARKRTAPAGALTDALAEAAWAEADGALAQALAAFDELQLAVKAEAREEALALLGQALARAARRRGLSRLGAAAGVEAFDPERHQLRTSSGRTPEAVRVEVRGVGRGGEVLVKARAAPARARKR